ncbi:MAG: hypothetical protein ACJ76N_00730 [Thermoanaerobaculia bacterium]
MTANSRKVGLWVALSLLIALRAGARESGPFTMALQYTPQESVDSSSALLAPVDYVNGKTLTKALSADDLVKWKNAGMPQEVIKAALGRGKG